MTLTVSCMTSILTIFYGTHRENYMARTVRSARGEMVDMDLLRIKETLGQAPKGATVQAREEFIDNKFKRRLRRLSETVATTTTQTLQSPTPVVAPVVAPHSDADSVDSIETDVIIEPAVIPQKKIISTKPV